MNRRAFECKIEECQRPLRRFLTALCCGDRYMADDLAQDACVKAFLACGSLADDERFMPWLLRIAYNTFASSRRSARPMADVAEARAIAADDSADSAFRYQALYRALDALSDAERNATLLFYMQGYSTAEIAAITGASDDAVRKQLSRARLHLKDLLK
ncbi:MAG: sigma-70 family RNA polymerase sigma factor [Bacteroides sp.]|nr:sigma-70 family RNA polymerase sigma factor [Bacteroides sp.]MCM1096332.1 sigma-70 family RNA polymerase sigma factor [Terasakiella sp.]